MRHSHRILVVTATVVVLAAVPEAAELQSRTIAAFDRYVLATTERLARGSFLWLDGLPAERRADALARVRRGALSIERVISPADNQEIEVPGGMVHHWVGTVFIPGADLDPALMMLQAYNEHERIYAPNVSRSRLLERHGDRFHVFLRFTMKQVITVVVNSEHDARFRRLGSDRAEAWIHSTRIAEVEHPGGLDERELPVGRDGGYLWRLNTYWRLLARDGGLYIQCESVSLTRGIPTGLGWLVSPFVTSIPRESLAFTLETTRQQLEMEQRTGMLKRE